MNGITNSRERKLDTQLHGWLNLERYSLMLEESTMYLETETWFAHAHLFQNTSGLRMARTINETLKLKLNIYQKYMFNYV